MAKRKTKALVSCTCEVCGKTFYASRPSKTCIDNSTCRVLKHQRKVEQEKIAKSFMMDMDSYQVYLAVIQRYPHLKEKTDALVFTLGAKHAALSLSLLWDAICYEATMKGG